MVGRSPEKYQAFLKRTGIEIATLTKTDAEEAARHKPSRKDLLDALIAASAQRHDATVWTTDSDFYKFLSKDRVRLF